jgi:AcrR family transcriptional regulator
VLDVPVRSADLPAPRPDWSPPGADVPELERIKPEPGPARARPLPPDERRAMLIAATVPLLARHGTQVTTRQIARAAGVAEGTIFRVFADKDELVGEAITQSLDPTAILAQLREVDPGLPLRRRLVVMTTILQRRLIDIFNLMISLRSHVRHQGAGPAPQARPTGDPILDEVVRLLQPDRDQFRCPVTEVARLLRLVMVSGSHPLIAEGHLLTPDEITTLVLDGVRRRPQPITTGPGPVPARCTDERGDPHC